MRGPTETPMEAGLRAVREMPDDPAPANGQLNSVVSENTAEETMDVSSHPQAAGESPAHAPDAAGDDARVEAIARAQFEDAYRIPWERALPKSKSEFIHDARIAIAADPATSRIRALEEANRALREHIREAVAIVTFARSSAFSYALPATIETAEDWLTRAETIGKQP